jgi:transcriptional regulator GlxA family with amidase domain
VHSPEQRMAGRKNDAKTPRLSKAIDWEALVLLARYEPVEAAICLGITERQLLRRCHAENGRSCREHFHRLRIQRAEQLLREDVSVKEVAITLFYSPAAFTRAFAEYHDGLGPRDFQLRAASAGTVLSPLHECLCPEI